MSEKSNRNGRAFEAIVFHDLASEAKKQNLNFSITSRGYQYHQEDIKFFNQLSDGDAKDIKLRNDYIQHVSLITSWLFNTFHLSSCDSIVLDKLPDNAGHDGDVTDIRLVLYTGHNKSIINLSLKNNSNALKHSRISSVPVWLGYDSNSAESRTYHEEYCKIWKAVQNQIDNFNRTSPIKVSKYNELDFMVTNYKNDVIYENYYNLINQFIATYCTTPDKVQHLFRHLVGVQNFYKIINKPKKIIIADYTNIALPTTLELYRNDLNYLVLKFNNDWEISLRLHNGDNKLSPSLKIDAQLVTDSPCNEEILTK